ncbi:MAG: hypothetical protein KJI72_00475 [Patescibacteria group bacterium]|nr:hypothetical protein [Patescibacteria group bacterium]
MAESERKQRENLVVKQEPCPDCGGLVYPIKGTNTGQCTECEQEFLLGDLESPDSDQSAR